jgi:hypothetical protein
MYTVSTLLQLHADSSKEENIVLQVAIAIILSLHPFADLAGKKKLDRLLSPVGCCQNPNEIVHYSSVQAMDVHHHISSRIACRLINFLLLVLHCSPPIPAPHPSLSSICSLYIYSVMTTMRMMNLKNELIIR